MGLLVPSLGSACSPEVQVGAWTWACTDNASSSNGSMDGGAGDGAGETTDGAVPPVAIPWSTGFEDGFCGFEEGTGFCFDTGSGTHEMVQSPVHSGRFAAAFTVDSSQSGGSQTRCVREGSLPKEAYYSAWYFIPALQVNTGNWNLFHFQGGPGPGPRLSGLWDVSLVNDASGNLSLTVLDFLGSTDVGTSAAPPVPIGSWFHIQFFLRRAADETGEVTVYQDGLIAFHWVDIVTDNTPFQQWYVGNLASLNALSPPRSTLYVDDVEISESR
jgi:hypothetical protein